MNNAKYNKYITIISIVFMSSCYSYKEVVERWGNGSEQTVKYLKSKNDSSSYKKISYYDNGNIASKSLMVRPELANEYAKYCKKYYGNGKLMEYDCNFSPKRFTIHDTALKQDIFVFSLLTDVKKWYSNGNVEYKKISHEKSVEELYYNEQGKLIKDTISK